MASAKTSDSLAKQNLGNSAKAIATSTVELVKAAKALSAGREEDTQNRLPLSRSHSIFSPYSLSVYAS